MLVVRKAIKADFDRVMEIYRYAQDFMIETGNPDQWAHVYPAPELVAEDIDNERCLVICEAGKVHGVFALFAGADPTYEYIEGGAWLNDEYYVTIHRIAGDGQVRGIFKCAADYCKSVCDNVRIDTHDNNKIMQKMVLRNGFQQCGIIYVDDGSARIAYQWAKELD